MARRAAFVKSFLLPTNSYRNVCNRACASSRTTMTSRSRAAKPPTPSTKPSKLTLLYDGECPLCIKEVNFLTERSSRHEHPLAFVDIAAQNYDPSKHAGITYEAAMGRIHAIDENGRVITGVQVFRRAYEAVGLGWVYALTKIPGISWLAERVYDIWADRRLQLTSRPPLIDILRERQRTCVK